MLSRSRLFAQILAEARSASSARLVDLAISVRLADVERDESGRPHWKPGSDVELLRVGGRWDRRTKQWAGEASRMRVVRVHRGQEEAARWFCEWLRRFVAGDWAGCRRAHSAMWVGARRSGKTTLAAIAAGLFAVAVPRSIVWMCSPTLDRSDELDGALRELLPREWYRAREVSTGKAAQFTLVNGSRILLRSGAKPEALRSGRCDFAVYNEAQAQSERGFVNLRGAVVDRGSIVIACANPPEQQAGMYVERLWAGIRDGNVEGVAHHFDARANPWIDHESLRAMEAEVDARTAARDLYGVIGIPIGDVVFHAWTPANIREPGDDLVDVTAEVARRELGRPAGYIIGVDLQRAPACVAAVFKVFTDPAQPGEELAWVLDEVEGVDEDDLLDELEQTPRWQLGGRVDGDTYRGWRDSTADADAPAHCAAVLDASGWWQDSEHAKGKSSDRMFIARRWREIYRPQPDRARGEPARANPDLVTRFKVANARICSAKGVRRLFVRPGCTGTIEAMRLYPNKSGAPDRRHRLAHRADAVSYVTFRLWGAVKLRRAAPLEYRGVGRFDRGDAFRDEPGLAAFFYR